MKKPVITKLGAGVLAVVLLCGCQPAGGLSDEKLINCTMANFKAALMAQDLDNLMAVYSEDYESTRGHGKEDIREFMERGIDEGFLDDIEVDIEDAKTTIEGDKAQFSPVIMTGRRGPRTTEFTLQKEEDTWRIVGSKRQRRREEDTD